MSKGEGGRADYTSGFKISGLSCIKFILIVLLIIFAYANAVSRTPSNYNNDATEKMFIGKWKISDTLFSGSLGKLFKNGDIEFHANGVGIAKAILFSDNNDVRFFLWKRNADTLFVDTLATAAKRSSVIRILYTISDSTMNLRLANSSGATKFSNNGNIKSFSVTLIRKSSDPLDGYENYLPAQSVSGKWLKACLLRDGKLKLTQDEYWNFYPSTNSYGEIFAYPVHETKIDTLHDLNFLKYSFIYQNVLSALTLANFSTTDTLNRYKFDSANRQYHADGNIALCYYSNEVTILMLDGLQTIYLVNTGTQEIEDLSELHDNYYAFISRVKKKPGSDFWLLNTYRTPLDIGTHREICADCSGRGWIVVSVRNRDPDLDPNHSGYLRDYNGNPVYSNHGEEVKCMKCNGNGFITVRDNQGFSAEYDASIKLTHTGISSKSILKLLPKGFLTLNLLYSGLYANYNYQGFVSTNINGIKPNAAWEIIPVENTDYFLVKNKGNGQYLSTEYPKSMVSSNEHLPASMWRITVRKSVADYVLFQNVATGGYLHSYQNQLVATDNDPGLASSSGSFWVLHTINPNDLNGQP